MFIFKKSNESIEMIIQDSYSIPSSGTSKP